MVSMHYFCKLVQKILNTIMSRICFYYPSVKKSIPSKKEKKKNKTRLTKLKEPFHALKRRILTTLSWFLL